MRAIRLTKQGRLIALPSDQQTSQPICVIALTTIVVSYDQTGELQKGEVLTTLKSARL